MKLDSQPHVVRLPLAAHAPLEVPLRGRGAHAQRGVILTNYLFPNRTCDFHRIRLSIRIIRISLKFNFNLYYLIPHLVLF